MERPVMIDAVSVAKVPRIEQLLPKISILKLNRLEAECLTGITLDSKERVKQACFTLVNRGVLRVFVTLGMAGVCAADKNGAIFVPALPVAVKDVTGAGDAFAAGVALRFKDDLRAQAEHGVELAAQYLVQRI
jgi:pseudouridine kinase